MGIDYFNKLGLLQAGDVTALEEGEKMVFHS